jgi:hypothetical protein
MAKRRRKDDSSTGGMIAVMRLRDLHRLFTDRYGRELSDDDAGRDDAFVMAHAIAWRPNAAKRIAAWLSLWAPWMDESETRRLMAGVMHKPIRWTADKLGARLNLTEAQRSRLKITTIGAVDCSKEERAARRKEKDRRRKQQRRRAAGARSRAEYEAQSASRSKPWEKLGMSRRSWYRAGKPSGGTSPSAA